MEAPNRVMEPMDLTEPTSELMEPILSPDLLPSMMAWLSREHHAAALVCSAWRDAWRATNQFRRWLRIASRIPRNKYSCTASLTAGAGYEIYLSGIPESSLSKPPTLTWCHPLQVCLSVLLVPQSLEAPAHVQAPMQLPACI